MWQRVRLLANTHLAGEWFGEKGAKLPVAPLLFQLSIATLLCLLGRGELPPYGYAIYCLSVTLALTTMPLLGELGPLLRADPAAEWIGAQPVRPIELRAGRVLVIAILLGGLALASLLPGAVLMTDATLGQRSALVVTGLAQTAFVAALLLWLQALLGDRAEGVLVLIQTVVFCGVIVGFLVGVSELLPLLAECEGPSGMLAYPPAWFAALLVPGAAGAHLAFAGAATLTAAVTFFVAPFPPAARARRTGSALAVLLSPLRSLATRFWVRREERGPFDLVYDALPAEREFVVRTYPLVAVPIAFLLLGAESGEPRGEGLFALLLFAPAIYLPILLLHVPATATPEARWLVDSSPVAPGVEAAAARKAVAIRFLTPLYVGLAGLTWARGDLHLALCLAPPAIATGLVAMRVLWTRFTGRPPLSTAPADIGSAWDDGFSGSFLVLAIAMTLLAILVWQTVTSPAVAFAILGAVVGLELVDSRRPRPIAG